MLFWCYLILFDVVLMLLDLFVSIDPSCPRSMPPSIPRSIPQSWKLSRMTTVTILCWCYLMLFHIFSCYLVSVSCYLVLFWWHVNVILMIFRRYLILFWCYLMFFCVIWCFWFHWPIVSQRPEVCPKYTPAYTPEYTLELKTQPHDHGNDIMFMIFDVILFYFHVIRRYFHVIWCYFDVMLMLLMLFNINFDLI